MIMKKYEYKLNPFEYGASTRGGMVYPLLVGDRVIVRMYTIDTIPPAPRLVKKRPAEYMLGLMDSKEIYGFRVKRLKDKEQSEAFRYFFKHVFKKTGANWYHHFIPLSLGSNLEGPWV